MNIGKQIIVLATLLLAMRVSWTYAMSPTEFAKNVGANPDMISSLESACQDTDNPVHCFGIGLAISNAESQMCNSESNHGCFGRVYGNDKSARGFVKSYKKYYYIVDKYNEGGMFYGYGPKAPAPTRYCMSEVQPNGKVIKGYCPNGRQHFNTIYFKYKKEVMGNNKVELKRNIADKAPIGTPKRCKIIMNAPADGYIQIDSIAGKFLARLKNIRKSDKIFFCWDINK